MSIQYLARGWLVPNTIDSLTVYGVSNEIISNTTVNVDMDLSISTTSAGVFMINYDSVPIGYPYPFYCSCSSTSANYAPNDSDHYWIVYPGWGFRLFRDSGYSSTSSRIYFNNTNVIQTFYCQNSIAIGTLIRTTSDTDYNQNQTSSARIYYRGTEISMPPIS